MFLPLLFLSGLPFIIFPKLYIFILEEFYFYSLVLVFISIASCFLIQKSKLHFKLSFIDLLITCYFVYFIINLFINIDSFNIFKFITLLLLLNIYILIRRVFYKETSIIRFINILMLVGFIEIVSAFLQLFELIPNLQPNMPFGGSFANPAPFSIFIACIVPLVFYMLLNNTKKITVIVILQYLFIILAVTIIYISKIRSSWIALVIGLGFIINIKYSIISKFKGLKKTFKTSLILLLVFFLFFSAYNLFLLKKDSALGRIFIWKNTIELIKEHPLIGIGPGNFVANYNKSQSDYFCNKPYTEKEYLLADEIKMAYNDILQITSEIGLIGLVLFIGILFFCFRIVFKYNLDNKNQLLVIFSILLVILIAGISSYPLTIIKIQFLFFILIALISEYSPDYIKISFKLSKKLILILKPVILVLVFSFLFIIYKQHSYLLKWKECIQKYEKGDISTAIIQLSDLDQKLFYHNKFKYNYTSMLISTRNLQNVESKFQELDKYYYDYNYMLMKANYYFLINNYIESEEYYVKALKIVPSRFIPRHQLMICYIRMNNNSKAINIAHEILDMPIKVYDKRVEFIQNNAKKYLGIIN